MNHWVRHVSCAIIFALGVTCEVYTGVGLGWALLGIFLVSGS